MSRLFFVAPLSALLLAALAGCAAEQPATPLPSPVNSRCALADFNITGQMMEAVQNGYSVRNVYYVRSNDFEHTLFLAGDMEGPDLPGSQDIGVWAIDL